MGKAQEESLGMTGVNFPPIHWDRRAPESKIKLNSRNQSKCLAGLVFVTRHSYLPLRGPHLSLSGAVGSVPPQTITPEPVHLQWTAVTQEELEC